jgi:membrane-associated protease RseP (regulator of RpoE activity)
MTDYSEQVDALVRRVFYIEDTTLGPEKSGYLVRYHGHLIHEDSAKAYNQLADLLKPLNLTPLFRIEEGRQMVVIIPSMAAGRPSNPRINLFLFILTLLSVLFTGGALSIEGELPQGILQIIALFLVKGWPFAVSMLGILAAHEFGHYIAGRLHKVNVTLPYFLPLPFPISPFGTMGAFINMKSIPKNRRELLDIGLAGPLAGIVVAIPVLLIGLSLSSLSTLPSAPSASGVGQLQMEGNSILYLLAKYTVFGQLLPAPTSFQNLPPVLFWLRYLFTSTPLPYGALDVSLHPVAWAGWGGLLITSLNLIPAGQLDGGHMIYVLLGRRGTRRLFPLVLVALVLLGFVWSGWWFWAFLIFLLGRVYAEPLDQITQLDSRRKFMAVVALILFILVFTPVPLITM